ncbi:MAG: hypothetical protein ABEJ64_02090 [Candidatus Nanohaloarchaea archaeon]
MEISMDESVVKNSLTILLGVAGLLSSIVGVGFLSEWLKSASGFTSSSFALGAFLFLLGMSIVVVLLSQVIEGE